MYKKIYIEITNNCNLKCDFCIKNDRKIEYIDIDDFKKILDKIEDYTNYLYLHILGEPLMHPKINELIDIASKRFNINITTNGYLINKIKENKNIRQINISIHSYNEKYGISIDKYLDNIFKVADKLKDNTYISYRFWVKSKYNDLILKKINEKYKTNLENVERNIKISDNVFMSVEKEFIWPDLNNEINNKTGSCHGIIDHIGILVDGTVVPCCLDSKGIINLGNIYDSELDEIIKTEKYQNIFKNFKNNKRVEKLCQKCNFM